MLDSDTRTQPPTATAGSAAASASLASLIETDSRPRLAGVLLAKLFALPVVGSLAARIVRAPNRSPLVRRFLTPFHARLLRGSGGRLQRSWLFAAGQPVLSLTTIGRRSGQARSTVVTCFTYGDQLAVAGMNLGVARAPAWALNLEADPHAVIELRGKTIAVTARRATAHEATRLWRRWVEVQPSAQAFRDLAGRDIPLFVLSRRD